MSEPISLTLPPELLEQFARRVAELLTEEARRNEPAASPWLDLEGACAHLGFSRDTLYKLEQLERLNELTRSGRDPGAERPDDDCVE